MGLSWKVYLALERDEMQIQRAANLIHVVDSIRVV